MKYEYKLSICMMVKDEETNMRRCLNSIKQLVEAGIAELIIVDTGSSDNTPDIALEYTDKIYFHKWNNNFSDMRNVSISYAKGEWIFIIDADEKLENPNALIDILNYNDLTQFNTMYLKVKNLVRIKDESQFTLSISPRFFRNDGHFRYEGAVHNQPMLKGPSVNIDMSIMHYGYNILDKQLMEKKFLRTSEILKKELKKDPNNLYYIYQLATSYDMHGDKKDSIEEFRKAHKIISKLHKNDKYNCAYILGSYARVALNNGILNESLKICKEALEIRDDYIDMYYLAGTVECRLGNEEDGLKYFIEFMDLINKFDSLKISKDPTISIYHSDPKSISDVCTQICRISLQKCNYELAYNYCQLISIKEKQAYLLAKILIHLRYYSELRNNCINNNDTKYSDLFISGIEDEIKQIAEDDKQWLFMELSQLDNSYGRLNQIRAGKIEEQINSVMYILDENDPNSLPFYYNEIYNVIRYDTSLINRLFKNINIRKIRTIVKYLIDTSSDYIVIFKEYLNSANIRANDLSKNKITIAIAAVILAEENNSDENYNIFKLYLERGINYVSQIFQLEKSRIIYTDINNSEDKFFVLIYLVNQSINIGNLKAAIKYFSEALKEFSIMVKYMNKLKEEIFESI